MVQAILIMYILREIGTPTYVRVIAVAMLMYEFIKFAIRSSAFVDGFCKGMKDGK